MHLWEDYVQSLMTEHASEWPILSALIRLAQGLVDAVWLDLGARLGALSQGYLLIEC